MTVFSGINRRRVLGFAAAAIAAQAVVLGHAQAGVEDDVKAMVAKAIALYDEKSEAAFAVFDQGEASGYRQGEVYIVVQSGGPDGKCLAHGADAKLVGTPLEKIADPTGKKFAVIMSEQATADGGWFDYQWMDPVTNKIGNKRAWAVRHKDLVFLAGYYVR